MATVISTPSDTANSYASIAFIKSQWDVNPDIDYSALTDEDIGDLGIFATQTLDNEYSSDYDGLLYNSAYTLFFPRTGTYDRRGVAITDYTVFPLDLQKAVAAQAWYLNSVDFVGSETSTGTISGVKRKQMEGLGEIEYFDVADQKAAVKKPIICSDARKYLESLVNGSSSSYVEILWRG